MSHEQTPNKTTPTESILSSDATARYTLKQFEPSADMAKFVEHYWIARWDVANGNEFTTEILPVPTITVAITSESSEVIGVVTGKSTYTIQGNGVVLGITFLPGGFYPFYKKPMDRLTNNVIPLSDLSSVTRVKRLATELSGTDAQLVTAAEKFLRSKKPRTDETVPAIVEIINAVRDNGQLKTVQDVSEKFDTSERTLQHVFQRYVGVGIKWIVSRYRLQDVADAIEHSTTSWETVAQKHGFTDPAHFSRDFKKIIGETPDQHTNHSDTQQ